MQIIKNITNLKFSADSICSSNETFCFLFNNLNLLLEHSDFDVVGILFKIFGNTFSELLDVVFKLSVGKLFKSVVLLREKTSEECISSFNISIFLLLKDNELFESILAILKLIVVLLEFFNSAKKFLKLKKIFNFYRENKIIIFFFFIHVFMYFLNTKHKF